MFKCVSVYWWQLQQANDLTQLQKQVLDITSMGMVSMSSLGPVYSITSESTVTNSGSRRVAHVTTCLLTPLHSWRYRQRSAAVTICGNSLSSGFCKESVQRPCKLSARASCQAVTRTKSLAFGCRLSSSSSDSGLIRRCFTDSFSRDSVGLVVRNQHTSAAGW